MSAKSDAAEKQAFEATQSAAVGADGLNPSEAFNVAMSDLLEWIAATVTVGLGRLRRPSASPRG